MGSASDTFVVGQASGSIADEHTQVWGLGMIPRELGTASQELDAVADALLVLLGCEIHLFEV